MVNRLSRKGRQALLVLHYISSVGWLGGGISQLTLNLVALTTGDAGLRHAAHEVAHVFDISMLAALSLGSAVTGILVAIRGTWGLLRYWWVTVKLVVTVALIVLIPSVVGGWIRAAINETMDGTVSTDYLLVRNELLVSSGVIITVLVLLTVISVVKPWGRTPWGERRRRQAGSGAQRRASAARQRQRQPGAEGEDSDGSYAVTSGPLGARRRTDQLHRPGDARIRLIARGARGLKPAWSPAVKP